MYRRGDFGQVTRALRVWDALRGFKKGRWITEVAEQLNVRPGAVRVRAHRAYLSLARTLGSAVPVAA